MAEYLISLTALIVVVLLIRGIFRRTISPRVVYALWLVVVVRMCLPVSLFTVEADIPSFLKIPEETEATETHEIETENAGTVVIETEQTLPPETNIVFPSETTLWESGFDETEDVETAGQETVPAETGIGDHFDAETLEFPVGVPVGPVETKVDTTEKPSGESASLTETVTDTEEEPRESIMGPINPDDAANNQKSETWKDILNGVWAAGAAVLSICFLTSDILFHYRLRKDRRLVGDIGETKVYMSKSAGAPCLCGIVPSIYITPESAQSKSYSLITLHEYVHLQHGDHIWSHVRVAALIVFWWNPLVWVAAFVSKQDAELACDDAVSAKLTEDKRFEYAHVLIDTIPQKRRLSRINGFGSAPMKERILMLTRKQKNHILCVIMAAILAVSAVGCSFVHVKEKETEATETKSPEVTETKEVETEDPKETDDPVETEEPAETRDLTSKEFSDELMHFYLESGEVYALFTKHASFDETEDIIYVNGAKYMAVDINGYTTIAELRDLCLQYFDEGLTRELISKIKQEDDPLFIEKDEKLYRSIGYSAQDQIDWYDLYLYIESTENGKVNFFADFELPNAQMTTTAIAPCTFILTDDGEIRFTAFSLMDEVIENGIENQKITTISYPQPDPSKGEFLVKVGSYGDLIYYGQDWIGMEGRPSGDATVGRVSAGNQTGVGYIIYGLGTYEDGKVSFSSYRTYRLEALNGYFIGFGSEDTVTRGEVLQYGTPYQGSLDGTHICEVANTWDGGLTYYKIELNGNEATIMYGPSHTGGGGWEVGEYTYDPETGVFKAVVTHQNSNTESMDQSIGLQREFSGKIYLYKGFVHFIKDGDDIPENSLPLTFKPQIIITDLADWDKLPWVSEQLGDMKRAANAYNFIYNLVSGKSDVPEYNGLGIKDYSIELLEDLTFGEHTLRFTFTVTGNSLPETLPPGTYTKIIEDGMGLSVFDCDDVPVSLEESYAALLNDQYGMDQFGGNAAAEAVHTFLRWPSYVNWYISPFGEWENDPFYNDEWAYQHDYYPYNYICGMYGDRSLSVEFSEMQRLLLEKFGIEVERPKNGEWLSHCEYDAKSDTVRYADTRGYRAVHRILDVTERDGVTDVTVQFYKDDHYLLPDFKVVYHIGEGEVFLSCEVIDAATQENTAS